LEVAVEMDHPGFYPRGGGLIRAQVRPAGLPHGFNPGEPSPVRRARVISAVAGLAEHIARRQATRATERLRRRGLEVESREESWSGGPGTMLGIELATEPVPTFFFALGERSKPAEAVADDAVAEAEAFLDADPAGIDEHSADQILLPLAFSPKASHFRVARVSTHLLTNAAVIQKFLARRIGCDGPEGGPGDVTVQ
jgi:RNA 3'-terminal phosphate cyclase (ATP)